MDTKGVPGEIEHLGAEKGQAYGVASVAKILQGIRFPVSRKVLMEYYGDDVIQWNRTHQETLADMLERTPNEPFMPSQN